MAGGLLAAAGGLLALAGGLLAAVVVAWMLVLSGGLFAAVWFRVVLFLSFIFYAMYITFRSTSLYHIYTLSRACV